MPKSKSKSNARVARSAGLPRHPALSQVDPMLKLRMGSEEPARLPDHYNFPTAATILPTEYTVMSDAAGHAVFAEVPDLNTGNWVVTAGTTAAAGTFTPNSRRAAFLASARDARQIFQKIQVTYIGAEQTSAGYLSACYKQSTNDIDSKTLDALHTSSSAQCKAPEGMHVTTSHTQEAEFADPSVAGFMNRIFPTTLFIASGLPFSTPVFRVRVWRWMEFVPKEGDLFEGEMQTEPHNPAAVAVHGSLSATAANFFVGHIKNSGHVNFLTEAANAAYHMIQPMAQNYVVGRAREYLTGAMARNGALMLTAGAALV